MKCNVIRIHKHAGQKKDALRAENAKSIPKFFRRTVTFDDNHFSLVYVEGVEHVPTDNVIGY